MQTLAEFQQQFRQAILQPDAAKQSRYGVGLRVYQNTVTSGLIDVLAANFPTVQQLLGVDWFRCLARYYVSEHLPVEPALALYGADLPEVLRQMSVSAELPYLPGVAQLDRLWTESHFAADTPILQAEALQALSPMALLSLSLTLHPAARYAWRQHGAVTIWRHHREATLPGKLRVEDQDEGVLITRPHGAIQINSLAASDYQFLSAVARGELLGDATARVLQSSPTLQLPALIAKLIHVGAFQSLHFSSIHTGQSS